MSIPTKPIANLHSLLSRFDKSLTELKNLTSTHAINTNQFVGIFHDGPENEPPPESNLISELQFRLCVLENLISQFSACNDSLSSSLGDPSIAQRP